ncbi:MAG: hypothetical protein M3X11_04520 [Acidobacteriota bacterium]|nr:hypothetical protein [Acidobacteriota bacterium]
MSALLRSPTKAEEDGENYHRRGKLFRRAFLRKNLIWPKRFLRILLASLRVATGNVICLPFLLNQDHPSAVFLILNRRLGIGVRPGL